MKKYLAFYENEWPANITELTAIENKPFVGYLKGQGVSYTVIPAKEEPASYKSVDLGLPSGLKWANMNVGATSPEDAGLYFQWGDTIGYTKEQVEAGEKVFNFDNYFDTTDSGWSFDKYDVDKLTVLESIDDAATVHMGSDWRMPTIEEIQELINNTTPTFIDHQGNEYSREKAQSRVIPEGNLKGVKFTSSNGNSIFISTTGICYDSLLDGLGAFGYLWSSNLVDTNSLNAGDLAFNYYGDLSDSYAHYDSRSYGLPIRGVKA